jgi:uncharacterized protein
MTKSPLAAHLWPFGLFLAFLAFVQALGMVPSESFWFSGAVYWVYPLQSLACGVALIVFWKYYDFGPVRWVFGFLAGLVALAVWISPQAFFGFDARTGGFDPDVFAESPALYWGTLLMRFVRLVIIVPLIEEIFWRGFLMRYLVNEDFTKVAFGTFTPVSFFGVAGAFMLVHAPADWPAAAVTGVVFGWVAVRTKSLFACVFAHAVTNLGLGIYIVATRQWGFW